MKGKIQKVYLGLLTITAWFALIFQFYLHINSGAASSGELVIRFFSYFTIDSNLLVAICVTSIFLVPQTTLGSFFNRPSVITAIAVYITVVALIYNTVLRFLWILNGWSAVLNELLHVVIPILFLIYWIFLTSKNQLKWTDVWNWLSFPLIYIFFVLIRGSYLNFYPYPFLNIAELGLQKVILNCIFITFLFLILFFAFVYIGRRQAKQVESQN